ncbi:MAG: aldehyde ferredoxin oxidoreductase family protein [Spirochaetota bacterium]
MVKVVPKENVGGTILHVDLTHGSAVAKQYPHEFFRTYLGGGAVGTYFLLKGTGPNTDPLSPDNILTVAPGLPTGAAVSGVSRCSVTALSPETGAVGDSQAGGSFGPFLKRAGFDALVITGKAPVLSYLYIHDGGAEIIEKAALAGTSVLECFDSLSAAHQGEKLSILQCGPAGERMVRFASLASDLHNVFGRCGLGAVFGSKNLRAIVAKPTGRLEFAAPDVVKRLAQKGVKRVNEDGAGETLKQYGTPGIVGGNAVAGNLCTHNYSSGFHEKYTQLEGANFSGEIGSRGTTCFACAIGCRKSVKAESPYRVTDRLGGPEFETLGVLGSNVDVFDPVAVAKANELCNNYGLDTITMGGIASFLCEAVEKGCIDDESLGFDGYRFGNPEGIFRLIELTAERKGVGNVAAEGFSSLIERFGEKTAEYAVHVKNHGFAVHMPQVKPSMALLYAVSPIGADHMSSEHDWIATDTGEAARGLGLCNPGEIESYGPEKVRAVTYSQLYYGLLDSLGLCMFVWGPGGVYDYTDLEELLRATSGYQITFWELMKAAERRITMMRLLNLRRGFAVSDDDLPSKMFRPLKGGASDGKAVQKQDFEAMRENYYLLMGWDTEGVPSKGKLFDLDLTWAV